MKSESVRSPPPYLISLIFLIKACLVISFLGVFLFSLLLTSPGFSFELSFKKENQNQILSRPDMPLPRPSSSSSSPSSPSSPSSRKEFEEVRDYCSSVPPISKQEMKERRDRVRNYLEESNPKKDIFITEPGASMRYFSGVSWKLSERPFLLVIPRVGDYFFLSPKFEQGKAEKLIEEGVFILTWEEDQNPFEVLFQHLSSSSSSQTFSVLVEHENRFFIQDGLREAFGKESTVENGLDVIRKTRAEKTSSEIALLRCANEVTKKVIKIVSEMLWEGISEDETASLLREGLTTAGLVNTWQLVLFGENAAYPHGSGDRKVLRKGELALIDTGGELLGYQSDISRTFPFPPGNYSAWQDDMWKAVKEAQQAALKAIQLGAPISRLDQAAREVMESYGYGKDYETFTHRLGHGIGLQGHEEVYAVRGNNVAMTTGQCFSVEPGLYIVGKGGVRLEDIVCLTPFSPFYELFGPESPSIDDPFGGH